MPDFLHDITFTTILVAILGYLIKRMMKESDDQKKSLESAIRELSHCVLKLTVQMELVLKQLEKIPEMEKDLAALGSKLRMNGKTNHDPED